MEWEHIDPYHQRCRVYGGWLVKAFEDVGHPSECSGLVPGWDLRVAMAFVPDPTHQWVLNNNSLETNSKAAAPVPKCFPPMCPDADSDKCNAECPAYPPPF